MEHASREQFPVTAEAVEEAQTPEKVKKPKAAPEPTHVKNPFWDGFEMVTRIKKDVINADNIVTLNTRTHQIDGTAAVTRTYEVDADVFVKVFARYLEVFFELSKNGMTLLEVVLAEVARERNRDTVYLSAKVGVEYHARKGRTWSQASFYRALAELIATGFLARSTHAHLYWTNPALFWNGDRVKFVTELKKLPEIMKPKEAEKVQKKEAVKVPEETTAQDQTGDLPFML